ncbi:Na+/H+ antiporter [Lipingzhangella sp. LS1_29]|uniref:Na+/H+ antiporter n=1 Tax=Lipingzhangella rawalii TaxID=2055835 RepID=A0ABU2H6Y1_9ACTN|nr:Na+/H+ antiporter [Lipingzhangella rawalii]MDS1270379.1 Na+/H+ antiporter [Lipingzhangella rawalii]
MSAENHILVGFGIVLLVLAGRLLAGRVRIPDAIVLVLLGLAVGYVPGLPEVEVPPQVVLLVFLPPLVFSSAFFSAPRELRAEARPIVALAVVTTLVTAFAIAGITYLVLPDVTWPAAIALGAAVAPTDTVAASAVLKRVGAPRRIVTLLEGESLINDGVALTLFGLAVSAMVQPVGFADGVGELVWVVAGGLVYGLVCALVIAAARARVRDGNTQLVISLLTPFLAYIPAEQAGFSGVLAAVVAGFYLGTRGEGLLPARVRATGRTIWHGVVALLESVLFVLLGLQLHEVFEILPERSPAALLWTATLVVLTVVGVRLVWQLVVAPLTRYLPGRLGWDPGTPAERLVVGWSGPRGAISLAIAMSLPLTLDGEPFPDRPVLLFLAGTVVLTTLVGQGMTLAPLLRWLGMTSADDSREELARAQLAMGRAALARIDELTADERVDAPAAQTYRELHALRVRQAQARLATIQPGSDETSGTEVPPTRHGTVFLRNEITRAEREALSRLYDDGEIGHEMFQALRRELDLTEPHLPAR